LPIQGQAKDLLEAKPGKRVKPIPADGVKLHFDFLHPTDYALNKHFHHVAFCRRPQTHNRAAGYFNTRYFAIQSCTPIQLQLHSNYARFVSLTVLSFTGRIAHFNAYRVNYGASQIGCRKLEDVRLAG
ncbi:MAG: hypothetical protein ACYC1F_08245, partial [Gallionellaceae bacterium]